MVDQLNDILPLTGCLLLDIGASPHGYAMERALEQNVNLYIGIGLDIAMQEYVLGKRDNVGMLLNMDATSLKFPDAIFDVVFSISVFEHVSDVSSVLAEMYRVLKPGGCALISFEPVWNCSYGHHLHHFPSCSGLIPPWAHLTWAPEKMREHLFDRWPKDAPLSVEEAVAWIYFGNSINRVNIREFEELIDKSPLKVSWKVDLREDKKSFDPLTIEQTSVETGLTADELTTKGLSLLMSKGSMK
ncbi:MAG: class I SAM-dependent methyltransferase [Candidatus Omnitrophica bacterium]|nr:class I SAM-dependent methyltransferase [Candidatus Omnitrophota bacterium]